ncbi:tRNAPhe (7-(3-amino-3-carboxypropyl)wyosine37-C2)-hydroxylase [Aureococcus anophagefferens]|uniref:tRNAPhe (7-(3-amino-3-carboxypropyl)wyosine37-C2)-hydroxylase n=1 Tax=Aureococcus anophagefferens TaxID=44056 RepID=A0ABR1G5D6_AURAN
MVDHRLRGERLRGALRGAYVRTLGAFADAARLRRCGGAFAAPMDELELAEELEPLAGEARAREVAPFAADAPSTRRPRAGTAAWARSTGATASAASAPGSGGAALARRRRARRAQGADFRRTYVAANEPVVLRGAAAAWKPCVSWTPAYLRARCGARPVRCRRDPAGRVFGRVGRVALYDHAVVPFGDLLDDAGRETPALYGARVELDKELPEPGQHKSAKFPTSKAHISVVFHSPELSGDAREPPAGLGAAFGEPKAVNPVAYVGGGRAATPLHFDPAENLLVVVSGAKDVLLFHPADTPFLYPCGDRNAGSVYSTVDAFAPDLAAHPDFARAAPVRLAVRAGDVLYLPCGWWHAVAAAADGPTVSVNFWFQLSSAKFQTDAALRILGLPQAPT